ncbi:MULTISPECIES: hypothetical protein [Nostocales]|uniref:Uncharacterized protein n=2 Tax=Nostocales TaxID=1161 RepID=A0ABW8WQU6_9CYAN|nr:hypothetical protein [Tolypothrix bouteillei]
MYRGEVQICAISLSTNSEISFTKLPPSDARKITALAMLSGVTTGTKHLAIVIYLICGFEK